MRKSHFSESKIIGILHEVVESGIKVADACLTHGLSAQTYYAWKSK
mgnify:CR=1 FL=1